MTAASCSRSVQSALLLLLLSSPLLLLLSPLLLLSLVSRPQLDAMRALTLSFLPPHQTLSALAVLPPLLMRCSLGLLMLTLPRIQRPAALRHAGHGRPVLSMQLLLLLLQLQPHALQPLRAALLCPAQLYLLHVNRRLTFFLFALFVPLSLLAMLLCPLLHAAASSCL